MTNNSITHYWYSFAIGSLVGGALVYFLGTKSGRSMLKKALETFEHLEEDFEDIIKEFELSDLEEATRKS